MKKGLVAEVSSHADGMVKAAAARDVQYAFYQFTVESMAEWFGLDDPVKCSEFGLREVYDNGLGRVRSVQPSEKVFSVFLGMP